MTHVSLTLAIGTTAPAETTVQRVLRELGMLSEDPQWARSRARRPKAELQRFVNVPRLNGAVLGNVYFAQAKSYGVVKIGWAVDVRRRIVQVSGESTRSGFVPGPMKLLASVPGVRFDEGRVHRALDAARATCPVIRGSGLWRSVQWPEGREWFVPTEEVRRVVEAFGGKLL